MIIKAQHNQNIFDLAIQHTGSQEAVFYILQANPTLELTDQLTPGQGIEIPQSAIEAGNKLIADYYAKNKITPATALIGEASNGDEYLADDEGAIIDNEGYIM